MSPHLFLVCGPLGAGKTSLINALLPNLSGKTGVVVNDFGPVGLDGKLLQAAGAPGVVMEVPGGCLCCTVQDKVPEAVAWMLEQNPDRMVVEPSGVARPTQLKDILVASGLFKEEEIHTICLLPVTSFEGGQTLFHPLLRDQAEAAELICLTHRDHGSPAQQESADRFLASLYPQRPLANWEDIQSGAWFSDLISLPSWPMVGGEFSETTEPELLGEREEEHLHGDGLQWSVDLKFDLMAVLTLFRQLGQGHLTEGRCLRAKGIFQTEIGPMLVEWAQGRLFERPAAWTAGSQCDVLLKDPGEGDWPTLWLKFEQCLLS